MFNLIKKDFIVSIKGEGKGILKYILLFLFFYFFQNSISYSVVPVFIAYLMIANTFYNDYKNNNINFINSIPTSKEDIVYSKYILSMVIIIGIIIVTSILNLIFSKVFHRQNVLNDVYYSLVTFTIIVSVILPIYFKFGYHNSRIVAGGISIVIFYIVFIPMNILSNFLYINALPGNVSNRTSLFINPLSNILNVKELDIFFLSFETITIISLLILIISMCISLKIINKKFRIKKNKQFLKISSIIVIVCMVFVLSNKMIYKKLVHEDNYRELYERNVEFTVSSQEYKDEIISVKVKINNPTKYTYILDDANLAFEIHENGDENNYLTSNLKVELPYDYHNEIKSENYIARTTGIEPNSIGFIEFTIPKGIKLDSKYISADSMILEYSGKLVSKLPFLDSGYITINNSESGSATVNIGILEELSKDKKGE